MPKDPVLRAVLALAVLIINVGRGWLTAWYDKSYHARL